jgi:hypothetical protein
MYCGNLAYTYYGHLVYFMVIWYILWPFGIFLPFLVYCTKKNLATLPPFRFPQRRRISVAGSAPVVVVRRPPPVEVERGPAAGAEVRIPPPAATAAAPLANPLLQRKNWTADQVGSTKHFFESMPMHIKSTVLEARPNIK